MTDDDTPDSRPWNYRPRPFTPEEIHQGRDAALDAWEASQAAAAWALDRSLDPDGPTSDLPAWADASTLTVDQAQQLLDWEKPE